MHIGSMARSVVNVSGGIATENVVGTALDIDKNWNFEGAISFEKVGCGGPHVVFSSFKFHVALRDDKSRRTCCIVYIGVESG